MFRRPTLDDPLVRLDPTVRMLPVSIPEFRFDIYPPSARSVDFASELPRTETGKMTKRKLCAKYWEGHGGRLV